MRSKTDAQRRQASLQWLATVRQATVDRETAAAYLLGLEDVPVAVLEQACRDLGNAERGEFETPWPTLGTIRARCAAIQRVSRERAESRKLLGSGRDITPISPEKWEAIKAQFRAVMAGKSMPGATGERD